MSNMKKNPPIYESAVYSIGTSSVSFLISLGNTRIPNED